MFPINLNKEKKADDFREKNLFKFVLNLYF